MDMGSLLAELVEAFLNRNGFDEDHYVNGDGFEDRQTPVGNQLKLLGFDELELMKLRQRRARGLDIGCGNGSLVNKMIMEHGIDFTGIDKHAPEAPYFMRQHVTATHPNEGCISVDDNTYDIVVAVQNGVLNCALGDYWKPCDTCSKRAPLIVYEGARVLKPGGKFIVFPCLNLENELLASMIPRSLHERGITKAVNEPMSVEYLREHYQLRGGKREGIENEAYRTIFTKAG